jgi:hypothetical protein
MRKKSKDPFGLVNFSQRMTLARNRWTGRMAEDSFAISQRLHGNEVKKTHRGRDFEVQRRDLFGRKIGKPVSYEVKTGDSQLSEAQRRRKARLGA